MYIRIVGEKCDGCGMCLNACPVEALHIKNKQAYVDNSVCRGCYLCVRYCPNKAIKKRV